MRTYYLVEGECEKTLIEELKKNKLITPGKVKVFNITQKKITKFFIQNLDDCSKIILIYDTDVISAFTVLEDNLKMLKKYLNVEIMHLQQVKNFEDEILRSTSLKKIDDFFNTKNLIEFKNYFIHSSNVYLRLCDLNFDLNKLWKTNPNNAYSKYFKIINKNKIFKF